MDPDQARVILADEPRYDWGFQEGRTCSVCGANVLAPDRDLHTRWHRALAAALGLGWDDLAARPAPADDPLTAAVDAVVHPRGLRRLSRIATAAAPWRAIPAVPLGEHGTATLLLGGPGVVVARLVTGAVDVRGRTVYVDGHRTPLADELRDAVGHVRGVLGAGRRAPLPVCGVLVVTGTHTGGDPDAPDVLAAAVDALPDRLAMLPDVLAFPDLDALHDRARRSTTWT